MGKIPSYQQDNQLMLVFEESSVLQWVEDKDRVPSQQGKAHEYY